MAVATANSPPVTPTANTALIGRYDVPSWFPHTITVTDDELLAAGRSPTIASASVGAETAKTAAEADMQAQLGRLLALARQSIRQRLGETRGNVTPLALATGSVAGGTAKVLSWPERQIEPATPDPVAESPAANAPASPSVPPMVSDWAVTARGVDGRLRVFCRIRLDGPVVRAWLRDVLVEECADRPHESPNADRLLQISGAIDDAWAAVARSPR